MPFGDFDLVQSEDGRGFCYFNRPHKELICAELTEDYTDVSDPAAGTFVRKFFQFAVFLNRQAAVPIF